jgi:hypothetical protein
LWALVTNTVRISLMITLNGINGRAVARLIIGSGSSATVATTTPGPVTYITGTYLRDADGWSVYNHEVKFLNETDYNTAMVQLSTLRRFKFQTGLDNGGTINWSPLQTQVLVSYKADASSAGKSGPGFLAVITGSDLLYSGAIWYRTRSWRGTANDIIGEVGQSFGLTPNIQPALTSPQVTLLQCYEPCLDFMRRVINSYLLGQSANDVTLAAHADTLMVGAVGWSEWPRYLINYPGDGVSGLEHVDHEKDLRYPGCRQVTGVHYNPTTGSLNSVTVDISTSVTRLAAFDPPGDPAAIFTHGRHSLPVSSATFWSRTYAEANLNQLGAALNVVGPDYLLAGALLTINMALPNDPFAGIYQVSQVYTEIRGGEAKSRVTLRRGYFNAAQITAPGSPPEAEAASPGATFSTNTSLVGSGVSVPIQSAGNPFGT